MKSCDEISPTPAVRRPLPAWIRVRVPADGVGVAQSVESVLRDTGVHTVCRGAACPNTVECFGRGTATFMILGGVCTRNCKFCAVKGGEPDAPSADEPQRVAEAARAMKLRHVVLTSVTRDDLEDGGSGHFAAVLQAVKNALPQASTEVLVPDFNGRERDVLRVLDAAPDVFNHNIETVRRLQDLVRPQADYRRSLSVLRQAATSRSDALVKSGLMVGLGETDAEVRETMVDLREAGVRLLTVGQYLAPSKRHLPVQRFVTPDMFGEYSRWSRELGFIEAASGPLVRSSFQAGAMFLRAKELCLSNGRL